MQIVDNDIQNNTVPVEVQPVQESAGKPAMTKEKLGWLITAKSTMNCPVLTGQAGPLPLSKPGMRRCRMTDKELLDHILSEMNAFFPEADFSRADGKKIVDKFWELECGRWQERIDKVFVDFEVKDLDGSGADSGDPLDFTELELYQAFNQVAAREAVHDE